MTRKKEMSQEEAEKEVSVWLGDAQQNIEDTVAAFTRQWAAMPEFDIGVEVMDVGQLRDAMGLRASIDWGDPWPSAEKQLHDLGFRWQSLSGMRVMYLKERDEYKPDTGWEEAEEYID